MNKLFSKDLTAPIHKSWMRVYFLRMLDRVQKKKLIEWLKIFEFDILG